MERSTTPPLPRARALPSSDRSSSRSTSPLPRARALPSGDRSSSTSSSPLPRARVLPTGDRSSSTSTSPEPTPSPPPRWTDMPQRRHSTTTDEEDERPPKVPKLCDDVDDDQDGSICPICLSPWDNTGPHRLISLKCGHLFGSQCIERWFQSNKYRSCPTCKRRVHYKDVRNIYARKVITCDKSEIVALQLQVQRAKEKQQRTANELERTKMSHRSCLKEIELLRNQGSIVTSSGKRWRFALEKNLQLCSDGGGRALVYNDRSYELYASQNSANSLFPGYGLRLISCLDYKPTSFLHLHHKAIRDLCYSRHKDLLVTASLDSTAKFVQRGLSQLTINTRLPLWSCTWDEKNENVIHMGATGGVIFTFDIRNTHAPLERLLNTDPSPVVSLQSATCGLFGCQLNTAWLYKSRQFERMNLTGPFTSLAYDKPIGTWIVSSRIGALSVFNVDDYGVSLEKTFSNGSGAAEMLRCAIVKAQGSAWVASYCTRAAAVRLHALKDASDLLLPAADLPRDLRSFQLHDSTVLATLSANRLRVYRAVAIKD